MRWSEPSGARCEPEFTKPYISHGQSTRASTSLSRLSVSRVTQTKDKQTPTAGPAPFSETHIQHHNYGIHLQPQKPLAWYVHIWTLCFVGHCVCVCFCTIADSKSCRDTYMFGKRKNCMQPKAAGMHARQKYMLGDKWLI